MSFAENFLYPLGLLIIGGGISAGLIPWFNSVHKEKLMEIEHERESSQKRIDREREDYRFELEIKKEFAEKLSERDTWAYSKFSEIVYCENISEQSKIIIQCHKDSLKTSNEIIDIILLYFKKNSKLLKMANQLDSMITKGIGLCRITADSSERKHKIEEFIKEFEIKMSKEDIDKSAKAIGLFEPLFSISEYNSSLRNEVLKTKVALPHSD
ncbi:MAG: hypothetical protein ACW9W4_08120 [Candidatus Nitrosopumilus sp. bin_7KS]